MKKTTNTFILFMPIIVGTLLLAPVSSTYAQCGNMIGLYTVAEPTGDPAEYYIAAPSGAGGFPMYIVITNPVDQTTGLPITTLGGYEFSVVLPVGWQLQVDAFQPGGTILLSDLPDFMVSGTIPITGKHTVVAEITIGSWGGGASGGIFLVPLDDPEATISGHMCVTDADRGFAPSVATPVSGSYDVPVVGINLVGTHGPCQPIPGTRAYDPTVRIHAEIGSISSPTHVSPTIVAEVDSAATADYDAGYDLPLPAPPATDFVSVTFEHADWPGGPRFQTDCREVFDARTDYRTVPLLVESDQSGWVHLYFEASDPGGFQYRLVVRDLLTEETRYLQIEDTYSLNMTTSERRLELIIGGPRMPSLAPTERTLAAGWSMVGLPLVPDTGVTIGEILHDQAPGAASAYRYSDATGYELVDPATPASQTEPLWFSTDTAFAWSYAGEENIDQVIVNLVPGWNFIGYPAWFAGPVDSLYTHSGYSMAEPAPWSASVEYGLVGGGVYGYDTATDTYVETSTLSAWHGYWIASYTNQYLILDWSALADPFAKSAAKQLPTTTADDWRTDLVLTDTQGKTRQVMFGTHPQAGDGFTAAYDLPAPPTSPAGGSRFVLVGTGWDKATGDDFLQILHAPLDGSPKSWTGRIDVTEAGIVELSWSAVNWPAGTDFQLYLPGQNRVVVESMLAVTSVELEVTDTLDFEVRTTGGTSSTDEVPGPRVALAVHPNPFNPQAMISFSLTAPGDVEVEIFTARGERIRTLEGHRLPAGRGELIWTGDDSHGRAVASGTYFARLKIDGKTEGCVVKMCLVR